MFAFSSVEQYHSGLTAHTTSCREAVEQYLSRIRSTAHLNAFLEVYAEEALLLADQLDAKRKAGEPMRRLHGVVIALKDVICHKDHRVSAASHILENFISVYSATAVQRLLEEEAIIIGRTNCDEFAMGSTNENSAFGKVLNALDETRVPGGSSGGSAVAVQAGLCMLSLGSDTGGSVRQPADFCGIVGMKPGYGRISRYGLIAYASSFDQIGIFGTNIDDVALALEIMSGPDEYDSTTSIESVEKFTPAPAGTKYRFAWFEEAINHPSIDPEIRSAIQQLLAQLQEQGHHVEKVPFDLIDYVVPAYYVLTTAEASSNLARYDGIRYGYRSKEKSTDINEFYKKNRSEGFGKEVKRRIMLGTFVLSAGYYDAYFTRAQKVRNLLRTRLEEIFNNFDGLILPTSPVPAFKAGEKLSDPVAMYLADIYTVMANLTGVPAISLPLFRHSNGMPFGVQVMANHLDELTLLRISGLMMEGAAPGQ